MSNSNPREMTEAELRMLIERLERANDTDGLTYVQALRLQDLRYYLAKIEQVRRGH